LQQAVAKMKRLISQFSIHFPHCIHLLRIWTGRRFSQAPDVVAKVQEFGIVRAACKGVWRWYIRAREFEFW
jgi:hypothetical protein